MSVIGRYDIETRHKNFQNKVPNKVMTIGHLTFKFWQTAAIIFAQILN